ncbi:Retrovirus-related Pol polyprotein from transposon opus [Dictyocoela muelleri]|nr:Retrovirus-related Pol polyprotein from transposon opus [Dictyocoela muelleri]
MLYKLRGTKIYTKLDLDQGFYQIRVKSEDIPKTGFRIMGETYVFLRMPFGLTNAPYTFQKAVNKTLEGIENTYYYIDDILIASKDIEAHYYDVKSVLDRLEKHNFGINFNKCQFEQKEIEFLGHIISPDGIKLSISKVDDIRFKIPKTKKQLEKLIGFINWFRDHVKLMVLTRTLDPPM